MTSGDWMPPQAPFDMVRRGYSPEQVTAHLERLEYDLRIATANRDATNVRLSELTSQLSAAQAEVDTLRTELDRAALEPVSMSGLSERMQRMIRLAEEEAGEIRARAEADRRNRAASLTVNSPSPPRLARLRHRAGADPQTAGRAGARAHRGSHCRGRGDCDRRRERGGDRPEESIREAEHTIAEANRIAELTLAESIAAAGDAGQRRRPSGSGWMPRAWPIVTLVDEDFEIAVTARRTETTGSSPNRSSPGRHGRRTDRRGHRRGRAPRRRRTTASPRP